EKMAQRLIDENGMDATLLSRGANTGSAYNPVFGPDVETPVRVFLSAYSVREIDGTKIRADDVKVLLSTKGAPTDVDTADRLRVGSKTFQVVQPVQSLQPAGIPLMYKAQCRA
ncbi:MAG: hypothetical protein KI785_05450, partial [Devosiaceae bacterium]|nr:hypothetical protein [Devosiaceae bacterium MH13]